MLMKMNGRDVCPPMQIQIRKKREKHRIECLLSVSSNKKFCMRVLCKLELQHFRS